MRPLWRLAYAGATRVCSAYLRAGAPGAAVYAGGSVASGRPIYALADLDLAVVLPEDRTGESRARVRARWERLVRAVPGMANVIDCCVYDEALLRGALSDSTFTRGVGGTEEPAVYYGPSADWDMMLLLERPELYGPTAAWRRVAGPERLPRDSGRDAHRRRIAAWLELQYLWRLALELCLNPDRPGASSMCVKLVAEPARIWMWLTAGLRTGGRAETLTEALARMPDEAPALERALALQGELTAAPDPPLPESLRAFLRLSSRVARAIAAQVDPHGTTEVALVGGDELALPQGAWEPTGPWPAAPPSRLLPLADWRAIVHPAMPDETFAPVDGDPADPNDLAGAALAMEEGPYPTLSADGLLFRPFHGGRGRLRAVQCAVTDPVSFAVAAGAERAGFPNVTGWSAGDTGLRAVAEHRAWLVDQPADTQGERLGMLFGAARAALFLWSIEDGEPQLPLTGAATARTLADRLGSARSTAEAAWEAYSKFAVDWLPPDPASLAALDEVVRALPQYVH